MVGWFILFRSTYVKTKFRQSPHDPYFAGTVLHCLLLYIQFEIVWANCEVWSAKSLTKLLQSVYHYILHFIALLLLWLTETAFWWNQKYNLLHLKWHSFFYFLIFFYRAVNEFLDASTLNCAVICNESKQTNLWHMSLSDAVITNTQCTSASLHFSAKKQWTHAIYASVLCSTQNWRLHHTLPYAHLQ